MRKGGHFGDVGRREVGVWVWVRGLGGVKNAEKRLKSKIRAAGKGHLEGRIYFPKHAFEGI